ncbi:HNH endonuclease signature motif containing protein [Cellulomonas fengjieae]|uniref:DUF222 domain-containing protein n=1 Tax=Cellulomonas fengjieae TaxID=2819978 RepID=A0ABS3SBZ7_9CELL|nr:HNH endonuclease signature motif containing protein [Cellulomonas fengjieae]MBO3083277.1 DUF222 domain-containing protein [Cellulomonas fengjieae]
MTTVLEQVLDTASRPASRDARDAAVPAWRDSGWRSRPARSDLPTTVPDDVPGVRDAVGSQDVGVAGLADRPERSVAGGDVGVLATMLGSVPVADLSDVALVNAVAAWGQVIAMAQAAQAEVVREIEARTVDALARVPDELACALVCTRRAAQDLFLRAWGAGQHPAVADAWAAGAIDARKVDVILAEAAQVEAGAVRAVVADAVEQAVELTAAQLTRHLRASVIGSDPAAAERRRVTERERRGVFLDLAPDAMARLIAYLPAAEATAAFTVIDALAGHGAPDGDPRTIDQRRADAFADVFTTILDRQATLDGTPLPRKRGRRVSIQVTVAASTLAGVDELPATLGSYGPIPAQVARELAQDATWRRVLTDPAGQVCAVGTTAYRPGADLTRTVIARDVTCTFPGCRQPATRCELDHRIPYDHSQARREHDADPQTCLENLHALCKHHHQAKTTGWWQVTWDKNTGISTWTDRHGLTYARHPIPVHTTPTAPIHRPPPPPPPDPGDPPF